MVGDVFKVIDPTVFGLVPERSRPPTARERAEARRHAPLGVEKHDPWLLAVPGPGGRRPSRQDMGHGVA
jgi:hypothetical protein